MSSVDREGPVNEESGASAAGPPGESGPTYSARWIGRETPVAGTELASYQISSGERLLICSQGQTGLEILDVSIDFTGPTYRVERALEDDAGLWALVDDYLNQARRLDAPPMSGEALARLMSSREMPEADNPARRGRVL